jgi:hypothetical protein
MGVEERPFPEYAALTAALGAVLGGFLVLPGGGCPSASLSATWFVSAWPATRSAVSWPRTKLTKSGSDPNGSAVDDVCG